MHYYFKSILIALGCFIFSIMPVLGQSNLSMEEFQTQCDEWIAKRDFAKAIALAQSIDPDALEEEEQVSYYLQLQQIYAPQNAQNFDSVIYYVNKVLPITKSDSLKTSQWFLLGNMYLYTGREEEARTYFQNALAGVAHLPTTLDSVKLFSRLSYTAKTQEEQLKWLNELNEVAQQTTDYVAQTRAYFTLLNYFVLKRNTEKVNELLPLIKASHYKSEDSVAITDAAKMIAYCYRLEGVTNLDSSLYYTDRAIKHLSSRIPAYERDILNLSLATIYYYKEEFEESLRIGKKAIKNLEESGQGNTGNVRQGYSTIGYSAEAIGRLVEAEQYFLQELKLARQGLAPSLVEQGLYSLIRIKLAQGKTDSVQALFDEFIIIKDSLQAKANEEAVVEAETQVGLTLAEQELENKNLRLAQQAQQQKWYIGLILLLFAILGGAFWAYQRINRDRAMISQQKAQVESALTEKEFLLKEIHHRVKNNLQIISSLLDKQARHSGDTSLKDKMQEGKDRIQSMALIHQNLYQSENLSSIDIRKYIYELAHNITATQQAPDQNIAIDIQADDLQLTIDQAIPLGLILNEMLTNTFKHAFKDRQQGLVNISFRETTTDQFSLYFSDNGKGMPPDFDVEQSQSLGMNLIYGLTEQLEGELQLQTSENGTAFEVQFSV